MSSWVYLRPRVCLYLIGDRSLFHFIIIAPFPKFFLEVKPYPFSLISYGFTCHELSTLCNLANSIFHVVSFVFHFYRPTLSVFFAKCRSVWVWVTVLSTVGPQWVFLKLFLLLWCLYCLGGCWAMPMCDFHIMWRTFIFIFFNTAIQLCTHTHT